MVNEKDLLKKAKGLVSKFKWNKSQTIDNTITNKLVDEGKLPENEREIFPQWAEAKIWPATNDMSRMPNAEIWAGSVNQPENESTMQKKIDMKHPDQKLEMAPNNMAEHDEDVDNAIMMIANIADLAPAVAAKLLPLAGRMVSKLWSKKFTPEVVDVAMRKYAYKKPVSNVIDDYKLLMDEQPKYKWTQSKIESNLQKEYQNNYDDIKQSPWFQKWKEEGKRFLEDNNMPETLGDDDLAYIYSTKKNR